MKAWRIVALVVFVSFAWISCASNSAGGRATITATAAVGTSFEKAVVINSTNEMDGVDQEYKWLRANYPGYKLSRQILTNKDNKVYDVMEIVEANSKNTTIYFDITSFYGKF